MAEHAGEGPLPPLLPVDEALRQIVSLATPVGDQETVSLAECLGRVLSEDIHSEVNVPPAANSAMDGIAIDTRDLHTRARVEQGEALLLSQRVPAGKAPLPLEAGTAARIFTGGELPAGADAVVIQEDCRFGGGSVEVLNWPDSGNHVRPRGQDIQSGMRLLCRGVCLRPADLGLLASAGIAGVKVWRRIRVAILATGDELQRPGQPLAPGQIYNSSIYTLSGLLKEMGCEVIDCGLVGDTARETRAGLSSARDQADLVLATGGVSVGEEDHVRTSIEALGHLNFWRIAIRPGKPLAVGRVGKVPVIGLPGNPVSSFVTFLLFARPFLLRMQGRSSLAPRSIRLPTAERLAAGSRQEYLRVCLIDGRVVAYGNQSSGVLSSVVSADGLAVVPPETEIQAGEEVEVLLLNDLRY